MKPRFTDDHRFTVPYVPAAATDIRRTFQRVRAELKAKEAERVIASNVKPLKRKT